MAQMLAKPGPWGFPPITPQRISRFISYRMQTPKLSVTGVGKNVKFGTMVNNQQLHSLFADTFLDHNACLDIDSKPAKCRLTHIVCTIGPASREVDMLMELMRAGMNVCRLNFSHGTYDYHAGTVQNIRDAAANLPPGSAIAIALDTKGPEIRTGLLEGGPSEEIMLETGGTITVTTDTDYENRGSAEMIWVDYKNIVNVLGVDSIIYIDDGLISLKVTGKSQDSLTCYIVNGGKLGSKKGCNLPGTHVDLPAISDKDKEDILFGLEQNVDMIFASFIQDGAGIREIRSVLGEKGKHIKIIAKIENFEGIYNFPEILQEADGVMVARGDMGIEIPPEKVFVAQKFIISACNKVGKPVICATQMLESMTNKPRATRSESGDVANAVLDGADCVMLSGESAKGLYPVEAVQHMDAVCLEAEAVFFSMRMFTELKRCTPLFADPATTVALSAVDASYQCLAAAIVVLADTGRTAFLVSSYRPRCPVIMVTRCEVIARQSLLCRGVVPHLYTSPEMENWDEDVNAQIVSGVQAGVASEFIQPNDQVIVVIGLSSGPGPSNSMQVITYRQAGPPSQ